MKILVYGAGVLGCNLARNLFHAGKDVTLLARGNWAEEIRKNGLRIKDQFSLRTSVSNIPVVTELAPNVRYDVIFVVLRYTQLDSALETLRANQTKNIVFVGNNVQARALAAALPEKNVLFAFAFSAGHREADRVVSIDLKKNHHWAVAWCGLQCGTDRRDFRRYQIQGRLRAKYGGLSALPCGLCDACGFRLL